MLFLTVFQSYQGGGWVVMKGLVQWSPIYYGKDSSLEWALSPGSQDQQAVLSSLTLLYIYTSVNIK